MLQKKPCQEMLAKGFPNIFRLTDNVGDFLVYVTSFMPKTVSKSIICLRECCRIALASYSALTTNEALHPLEAAAGLAEGKRTTLLAIQLYRKHHTTSGISKHDTGQPIGCITFQTHQYAIPRAPEVIQL